MNCHYCGTEITGNEIFCRHCGTRLQKNAPLAEPVAVAVEEPVAVAAAEPAPVVFEVPKFQIPSEPLPVPQPAPVFEEKTFSWQPYGGAPAPEEPLFDFEKAPLKQAPALKLPTKRSLVKMIFLSILTLGIYPMVIWSRLVSEVNMTTSRYDGERSMSFFGMLMLSPITLGIHSLVWFHKLCRRIGAELQRRSIPYAFGAKDFWLCNILFSFLSGVCMGVSGAMFAYGYRVPALVLLIVGLLTLFGPFVFIHKLMKSMNKLNEDYNING